MRWEKKKTMSSLWSFSFKNQINEECVKCQVCPSLSSDLFYGNMTEMLKRFDPRSDRFSKNLLQHDW
jgi:hypothetical protein